VVKVESTSTLASGISSPQRSNTRVKNYWANWSARVRLRRKRRTVRRFLHQVSQGLRPRNCAKRMPLYFAKDAPL